MSDLPKTWMALILVAITGCVVIWGGRGNTYEINVMDRESQSTESTSQTETNEKTGVSLNANTQVQKDVIMKDPKSDKFDTVRMEIDTTRIKKKK